MIDVDLVTKLSRRAAPTPTDRASWKVPIGAPMRLLTQMRISQTKSLFRKLHQYAFCRNYGFLYHNFHVFDFQSLLIRHSSAAICGFVSLVGFN
mmetsp:Transcript_42840/g.71350  ORF Transcript_42840/g.71350 Transcript_42840/m.71350 type:complete len:94 (-) Transcript_42840:574-855(-)